MMKDTYLTIAARHRAEIPAIKGSRFIGEAVPVRSAGQAEAALAEIRNREPNATHNCSAFRIGLDGNTFRTDDDGEPSGTAGAPILRQIDGRGLVNVLVVVIRYYGGTKLGTGGLIRAYGEAAAAVLEESEIVERILRVPVRLTFGYDDTSSVMQAINQLDVVMGGSEYSDVTRLTVRVRKSQVAAFEASFRNGTAGRGLLEIL